MNVYSGISEVRSARPTVCTVGAFDGVHLGHQQLIRATVAEARAHRLHSAVITFHPHPDVVLGKGDVMELTSIEAKTRLIENLKVDSLIIMKFNRDTMQITADQFVRQMIKHLKMLSLWVGPDFALGNKRQGDAAWLTERGHDFGFAVNVQTPLLIDGLPVSSTRLRQAVSAGDLALAERLSGRTWGF